jgi:hypothetical protein
LILKGRDGPVAFSFVTIVNPRQHPAALLEELPDELAVELAELFPTSRRISAVDVLHEERLSVHCPAPSGQRGSQRLGV